MKIEAMPDNPFDAIEPMQPITPGAVNRKRDASQQPDKTWRISEIHYPENTSLLQILRAAYPKLTGSKWSPNEREPGR